MFRVFDPVVQFLRQNPSIVIGWLVTIITTAVLHPIIAERIRRVARSRDDHLADLKGALISPIKTELENKILPILTLQHGNVGLFYRIEPQVSAGMMDKGTKWTEAFGFQQVAEPPISAINPMEWNPRVPPQWLGALYDDAYDHHFGQFLRLWSGVTMGFEQYNKSCIAYAGHLRTEILRQSPLPDLNIDGNPSRYVLANRLALFVFYRQIGLRTHEPARVAEGAGERLTYLGAQTLAQGTPQEITRCISIVDHLIAQRETVEQLDNEAKEVLGSALRARRDIDYILSMRRLRGKCPYLA